MGSIESELYISDNNCAHLASVVLTEDQNESTIVTRCGKRMDAIHVSLLAQLADVTACSICDETTDAGGHEGIEEII